MQTHTKPMAASQPCTEWRYCAQHDEPLQGCHVHKTMRRPSRAVACSCGELLRALVPLVPEAGAHLGAGHSRGT